MRRQSHTDIHDVYGQTASSQQFSSDLPRQDAPINAKMSSEHANSTSLAYKPKKGNEPWQNSLSERKLRATAFAARVHSLKYYIGLIGAKSII